MAIFSIVPNITFSHFHRTECDYRLSFENGGIDCVNFPPSLPLWDALGARWSNILITLRHRFEGYAGSLGFNRSRWRSFIVFIVWKSFLVVLCKTRLLCYTISVCLPYISLISESVDLYLQTNIIRKKRIKPGGLNSSNLGISFTYSWDRIEYTPHIWVMGSYIGWVFRLVNRRRLRALVYHRP